MARKVVVVPPLVLVAGASVAQRLLARPARRLTPTRLAAAAVLGSASAAFAGSSVREFRRSHTTVNPMSPERATVLVTGGPHRLSRNPMYVGMAGALAAHAVGLGRWQAALPVIGFAVAIDRIQIPLEEAALTEHFGPTYAAYAKHVPRWLGLAPRPGVARTGH